MGDMETAALNVAVFAPPVIPGPADPFTGAAAAGEPGHLERCYDRAPAGVWPVGERHRSVW